MDINRRIKLKQRAEERERMESERSEDIAHPFRRQTRVMVNDLISLCIDEIYKEISSEVVKDLKNDLMKLIGKEIKEIITGELKRQIEERVDKIKNPPIFINGEWRQLGK